MPKKREEEATKRREDNRPLTPWERETLPQKRAEAIASGEPVDVASRNVVTLECLSASLDGDKLLLSIRIDAEVHRPGVVGTYLGTKVVEVKAMVEDTP